MNKREQMDVPCFQTPKLEGSIIECQMQIIDGDTIKSAQSYSRIDLFLGEKNHGWCITHAHTHTHAHRHTVACAFLKNDLFLAQRYFTIAQTRICSPCRNSCNSLKILLVCLGQVFSSKVLSFVQEIVVQTVIAVPAIKVDSKDIVGDGLVDTPLESRDVRSLLCQATA